MNLSAVGAPHPVSSCLRGEILGMNLHDAGVLRRKFNRLYQAYAQELQAEINDETLETVASIEADDLHRFGRIRDARDKELRDPNDVFIHAEERRRNSPNSARNADSLSQFKPDRPAKNRLLRNLAFKRCSGFRGITFCNEKPGSVGSGG
jgi:hypothetical protein